MVVVGRAQPPTPGRAANPPPPTLPPTPPPPPWQVLTDSWGGCRIRTGCSRPPRGTAHRVRAPCGSLVGLLLRSHGSAVCRWPSKANNCRPPPLGHRGVGHAGGEAVGRRTASLITTQPFLREAAARVCVGAICGDRSLSWGPHPPKRCLPLGHTEPWPSLRKQPPCAPLFPRRRPCLRKNEGERHVHPAVPSLNIPWSVCWLKTHHVTVCGSQAAHATNARLEPPPPLPFKSPGPCSSPPLGGGGRDWAFLFRVQGVVVCQCSGG